VLGAIAGDIIGSAWEANGEKRYAFPLFTEHSRFTDDTAMTVAVAHAILTDGDYAKAMRAVGRRHPLVGYGQRFQDWLFDASMGPYGSYGNGAAMRTSPVAEAARSLDEALSEAQRCAALTHDHPDGVTGAQAVAMAVFLARSGAGKDSIRREVASRFAYDLNRRLADVRPGYSWDLAASRSVPEAILCFLEAESYEAAVRNAVSLGGDADTMACIAGAIAEAHWGAVPASIARPVRDRLPDEFTRVLEAFEARFPQPRPSPVDASWAEFVAAFDAIIAPIYHRHELDFDLPGIHGRMHAGRAALFAEVMARYYRSSTAARPALNDARYATAFHDAARRANGPDLWDHESAQMCVEFAARNPGLFSRDARGMAGLLAAKPDPGDCLEAQIVHDADVLEIMRPCCGHGGRDGFREVALIFLGDRDPVARDADARAQLIDEAWTFIVASEERKDSFAGSPTYLASLLALLREGRSAWPGLAKALLGPS
jgi:ADP-ribosyl-[dinitrogen reductase] hydrolase